MEWRFEKPADLMLGLGAQSPDDGCARSLESQWNVVLKLLCFCLDIVIVISSHIALKERQVAGISCA